MVERKFDDGDLTPEEKRTLEQVKNELAEIDPSFNEGFKEIRDKANALTKEKSEKEQLRFVREIDSAGIVENPNPKDAAKKLIEIFNTSSHIEINELEVCINNIPDEVLNYAITFIEELLKDRDRQANHQNRRYEQAKFDAEQSGILCRGLMGPTGGVFPALELPGSPTAVLRNLKKVILTKLQITA